MMSDPWERVRDLAKGRYLSIDARRVRALLADADALLAVVRRGEDYIEMLEYCAGGMIAEFGAKHVHSTIDKHREALAALPEHLKGSNNG